MFSLTRQSHVFLSWENIHQMRSLEPPQPVHQPLPSQLASEKSVACPARSPATWRALPAHSPLTQQEPFRGSSSGQTGLFSYCVSSVVKAQCCPDLCTVTVLCLLPCPSTHYARIIMNQVLISRPSDMVLGTPTVQRLHF